MTRETTRTTVLRRRRDAEEMQPWRCTGCNAPVRPGFNDPCKCIPATDRAPVDSA